MDGGVLRPGGGFQGRCPGGQDLFQVIRPRIPSTGGETFGHVGSVGAGFHHPVSRAPAQFAAAAARLGHIGGRNGPYGGSVLLQLQGRGVGPSAVRGAA